MAREIPIQNGRLETNLDANGHSIDNLPAGFPSSKQDVIVDLQTIRAGAAAGATAVQPSELSIYVNAAAYDSQAKKILLKNGTTTVAEIDATAFIKDGMVSNVAISGGNLVITFNTDAGKDPISILITDIFNPSNYYSKTAIDDLLAGKVPTTRKVNDKPLSADVTLTASDVGALGNSGEQTLKGGSLLIDNDGPDTELRLAGIQGEVRLMNWGGEYRGLVPQQNPDARWYWPGAASPTTLALISDFYTAVQQIAPAFTPKAYSQKDLCTYNGVFYRCKEMYTATSSSPKPDSDAQHWEAKKVSELFLPLTGGTIDGEIRFRDGNLAEEYDHLRKWYLFSRLGELRVTNTDGHTILFPVASGTLALLSDTMRFSAEVSYAVGDVVFYNGAFYRCTTAHTAGAWNALHFMEVIGGLSTGTPTAPTPAAGDDSTKVATTEFVKAAVEGATPNLDYVMRVDPETGGIYYTTPDTNA